jgi:hypothetical protein
VEQLTEHGWFSPYTPAPGDLNRRVGSTLDARTLDLRALLEPRGTVAEPTAGSLLDSMRGFLCLLAVRPAET